MISIELAEVKKPIKDNEPIIYKLTDNTMKERRENVLKKMASRKLDTLIIYGDLEHGSNYSYLTGFVTRFEESLLVLHQNGDAFLVLGNENTKMVNYSRINAQLIHCPLFSLPNQPMDGELSMEEVLKEAGITNQLNIGVVGWKMFTSAKDNSKLFDIPFYIIEALKKIVDSEQIINATDLFIDSDYGVRAINNANEIAYYEYGSSLASDCVLDTIDHLAIGKSELEMANYLTRYGQTTNVIPIFATGERFDKAYIYPSDKKIKLGDKISITTGYKGGLASRSGYAAHNESDLPANNKDYISRLALPYFRAVVYWLENMKIGTTGKEIYALIETVLPKNEFHWKLNPGHLTSDEEWMSSPLSVNASNKIKSGMLFQIDIIPSIPGYAGAGCENGVAIADSQLRKEIEKDYPNLWSRIVERRAYLKNELEIDLPDEVLPLSSGVAYYTPYLLNSSLAFKKIK